MSIGSHPEFLLSLSSGTVEVNLKFLKGFYSQMKRVVKTKKVIQLTKTEREILDKKVKKYLVDHPDTLLLTEDLRNELNLELTTASFAAYLKNNFKKMGLFRVCARKSKYPYFDIYYGFSDYCESGECYYDWCLDANKCKKHQTNPKLHFYKKENSVY